MSYVFSLPTDIIDLAEILLLLSDEGIRLLGFDPESPNPSFHEGRPADVAVIRRILAEFEQSHPDTEWSTPLYGQTTIHHPTCRAEDSFAL